MNKPTYSGNDLIAWGYKPGKRFPELLAQANRMAEWGAEIDAIRGALDKIVAKDPVEVERIQMRETPLEYADFLSGTFENIPEAVENQKEVHRHMGEIMRLPPVLFGAVMPDACPAGSQLGTIPVGGVVAANNAIFPGMHSADVCCSMMATYFPEWIDPKTILDAAQAITHFGPGGRRDWGPMSREMVEGLLEDIILACNSGNPFLEDLEHTAISNFMTQGDGNHFLFVGTSEKLNTPVIVTHHGSRGFGAQVYKRGLKAAKRITAKIADVPPHMAWIPADSEEGKLYWEALQVARAWTKLNHYAIHSATAGRLGYANPAEDLWTIWNEHNFVFKNEDGLFYHAKGATPSYSGFSEDDQGFSIIPMNMGHPILITRHANNAKALGFAPHGAGRNMSRTAYLKRIDEDARADHYTLDTEGLDVRWFSGKPDLSECPSAYKFAPTIVKAIAENRLAEITDLIKPYGSIMAGELPPQYERKKK